MFVAFGFDGSVQLCNCHVHTVPLHHKVLQHNLQNIAKNHHNLLKCTFKIIIFYAALLTCNSHCNSIIVRLNYYDSNYVGCISVLTVLFVSELISEQHTIFSKESY